MQCWGINELLWLYLTQHLAIFGVCVMILSAVMLYPIFSPSSPSVGPTTQLNTFYNMFCC